MIGFSYIYKNSDEILQSVSHLKSINISDIFWLIIAILIVIICVFMLFPSIMIIHEYKQQIKKKKNKKKILTQILLQKEIEDEVENEIQIEGENEVI